jgi:hypothetical protein
MKSAIIASNLPVVDSFTGADGTPLENHLTDSGQSYLRPGWSQNGTISLYRGWALHGDAGYRSTYLANVQLAADQYAQVVVHFKSDGVKPELKSRADPSVESAIQCGYSPKKQQWYCEANEYGTLGEILLGSWNEPYGTATRKMRVESRGYGVKLFVDDVLRIDAVLPENVEYNLSGPGMAGFSLEGASTTSGTYLDNFEAGNIVVEPTPTPTPTPSATPTPTPAPCGCTWHVIISSPTEYHTRCDPSTVN